ncbi:MAG: nucleotidyltransferase domain-containing protein [Candidatus Aegiribacteria sp.]|nr:nucleotidyltransferase domain-containing protein [Candidatus Aegiribacteria sp.]
MKTLESILSSRTRAELFTILFGLNHYELHNREIARRTELSEASVRQELGKLTELNLVTARRDGNRIYYSANKGNPLYHEIHSIVLKTTGLVDVLKEAFSDDRIETAFVFGSFAEGEETSDSDVDLLIIGDIGFREVSRLISGIHEMIERDINPVVLSRSEYIGRLRSEDHLVNNVLAGTKLFVKGDADEFAAMGE